MLTDMNNLIKTTSKKLNEAQLQQIKLCFQKREPYIINRKSSRQAFVEIHFGIPPYPKKLQIAPMPPAKYTKLLAELQALELEKWSISGRKHTHDITILVTPKEADGLAEKITSIITRLFDIDAAAA